MRRSWLGLQLLLSCALLLAAVAVEGRCCKEEESSSEEECHCEKRHHCMEECCEKRCHHEEEECCCSSEEECHCEKRHHCVEECCEKRCHHEEEECCCERRHHHKDEDCCKKKHSHGKEESGKKKHSHVEEEKADKNKGSRIGKKHPKKRHPLFNELEEASSDSNEQYELMAKEEQKMIMEQAAQNSDAVPHYRKEQAIVHFNRGNEGSYYKHLEDGQLEFQEAIGVMVYVKMLLAKTNCTRTKEQEEAGVEYSRAYLEKEGCQLLPKFKQEKHNCTFGIFINMRTEKKAVISQDCIITPAIKLPIF